MNQILHIYINDKSACNDNSCTATSFSEARQIISKMISQDCCPQSIIVHIPQGIYSPDDFQFTEKDCSDNCRICYLAEQGAIIDGGLSIPRDKWKLPDEKMMQKFSPECRTQIRMVDLNEWQIAPENYGTVSAIGAYETSDKYDDVPSGVNSEVYIDNQRMVLARYPNQGTFAKLSAVMDVGDVHEFPDQNYFFDWDSRRNHRGGSYVLDIETTQRIAKWKTKEDIWMFGYFYYDWADSSTPVTFDTEHRLVFPKYVSFYGARANAPYYLYNIPEELDVPLEWYLDRATGKLYFYPPEKGEVLRFTSCCRPLLSCINTRNMLFSGFELRCTTADAVVCTGNNMQFENLVITNISGTAICCTGSDNVIAHCDISHTGKGGIIVTGGERETLTPGRNRVTGNYIHEFSEVYLTYQAGVRLNGVGNCCDHNEIAWSPHMAIGYSGNEHFIAYNDIHHVVLQSSDAGAIYSGYDWAANGTVICHNLLRHIGQGDFTPDGIYWDDGLSGQTAYGNILIDVRKNGLLAGGGRENRIENNIFIDCGMPISYDQRNRDGFICNGWAHAAVDHPDAPHWQNLNKVPFRSDIWSQKYPRLAQLKTDFYSDPDDPDFPINPAYCSITNNVIIDSQGRTGDFAPSLARYSTVEKNLVFTNYKQAGFDPESFTFVSDSIVFEKNPLFSAIPVTEIGQK